MSVLRYGINSSVRFDGADGATLGEPGVPRGQPLADASAATAAALAEPLDYPPLRQCTTPVDRVVLVLDHGATEAARITAAVVHALADAGVEPDGITILQHPADRAAEAGDATEIHDAEIHDAEIHNAAENNGAGDPRRLIPAALRERIALRTHDPTDRRELAYLAADEAGEAILVNRALHDADVILPIGCLRDDETAGYFGIHGLVYPAFSDAKTLQRFRGLGSLNGRGQRRRELVDQVEHVAWLLGINFTIQLVPAAGGRVMHVVAGQSDAVRRRGRELYRAAWRSPPIGRASLVVAAIEGGAGQQTWENVAQALHAAGRFAEPGGAIALCCELAAPPGPAVQYLAGGSSRESALRHVAKERPIDALAAAQIAQAVESNKVYLLSRLDPAVVEDLDMVSVAGPDELVRLARRHASCVLLSNAPYVTAGEAV